MRIQKPVVAAAAAAVLLLGLGSAWFLTRPLPVEYADLSPRELSSLKAAVIAYTTSSGVSCRLSETAPVKGGTLFAHRGVAVFHVTERVRQAEKLFGEPDTNLTSLVALSLRATVRGQNGHLWAQPLMTDHLEFFYRTGQGQSSADFDAIPQAEALFAKVKEKGGHALAFSGSSDSLFLDIIGQFVASSGGLTAYRDLCALTLVGSTAPEAAAASPELRAATELLSKWKRLGYLHPNWADLEGKDIGALFKMGKINGAIQTLETHRTIDREDLERGRSGRVLPRQDQNQYLITAPVVAAAIPATGRWKGKAADFLAWLSSPEGQRILCTASGLSPAVLAVTAPDIQAREVREWASSATVIQGLSRDGFTEDTKRAAFASSLRDYMRSLK